MNKTKIEWCNFSINPVKGLCLVGCSYCYARRMYKRFKWNPEIKFNPRWHYEIDRIKIPSKIFVGSTMELFGDWIKQVWMENILERVKEYPQHTFIFLTKQPQNLPKEFPPNCWVGSSATDHIMFASAYYHLTNVKAKVKFISIEPLLNWNERSGVTQALINQAKQAGVNWLITGLKTPYSKKTAPKIEIVREIVNSADKAGIPIFLKENLKRVLYEADMSAPVWNNNRWKLLRQEFPKVRQYEHK